MAITATTDYKSYYEISGNPYSEDGLESYIDSQEPELIRDLLGVTLGDLFIADLVNGVPQTQRFIDIFNPIAYDDNSRQVRGRGIKIMLLGFIYYAYVKDSDFINTIAGNVKNTFSNSERAKSVEYGLYERYCNSILDYEAIQKYICDNESTYPEYNGQEKEMITWL